MTEKEKAPVGTEAMNDVFKNNYKAQPHENPAQIFPVLEPWSEPVNGAELADEIKALFDRYLYLPNGASAAVTLWVMHTYGLDCFEITPRLGIESPMPRCGKSTLLSLIGMLAYRPLQLSSITAAAMFRIIAEYKPTLLIDEADTFLSKSEELRGIINAGYEYNGTVSRVETINKKQVVSLFPCYGACAISGIGGKHKTIEERSVNIVMERKTRADKVERLRKREIRDTAIIIQQKCLRWVMDNAKKLTNARPEMPLYMGDRAADIWEPLFAIAETLSPSWLEQINHAAKALNKTQPNEDETSLRLQLLDDIKVIFAGKPADTFFASTHLVELLRGIEESPWDEYGYGKGLKPHSLAKQLRFFGIVPRQLRNGDNRNRGYYHSDFFDAFNRYLPECTPPQDTSESEAKAPTKENLDKAFEYAQEFMSNKPYDNLSDKEIESLPDIPY